MKQLNFYIVAAVLLLPLPSIAQKKDKPDFFSIKPLKIGDTMPKVAFEHVINYSRHSANLADFKNKAIVLDFWTVHCSACIASFPELQRLQEKFKDELQIILVSPNNRKELESLSKKSSVFRATKLPIVFNDTLLYFKRFPHYGDPYQVWLNKEHQIKTITKGWEATEKNIQDLILSKDLDVFVRRDITDTSIHDYLLDNIKERRPTSLLTANSGKYLSKIVYYRVLNDSFNTNLFVLDKQHIALKKHPYYSTIMDTIPGVFAPAFPIVLKNNAGKDIGVRHLNKPIIWLFRDAYNSWNYPKIIVEQGLDITAPLNNEESTVKRGNWWVTNSYCYEAIIPDYSKNKYQQVLKQDLQRFFGAVGLIEEKQIKCLILYRTTSENRMVVADNNSNPFYENTQSEKGFIFRNYPFSGLVSLMISRNNTIDDPQIIDETGFAQNTKMDMILKIKSFRDNPLLRGELARYGIGLKEEYRKVKVFVIKKATEL